MWETTTFVPTKSYGHGLCRLFAGSELNNCASGRSEEAMLLRNQPSSRRRLSAPANLHHTTRRELNPDQLFTNTIGTMSDMFVGSFSRSHARTRSREKHGHRQRCSCPGVDGVCQQFSCAKFDTGLDVDETVVLRRQTDP